MSFVFRDDHSGERTACAVDKCTRRWHHKGSGAKTNKVQVWMNNEDIHFTYMIARERLAVQKPVDNGGCHDPQLRR